MAEGNSKFTVLVVDDDPSIRTLVPNVLRSKGYKVLKATNGKECIAQAEQHAPDLILCDVNMPEMDGFEACEHLKRNPQTKDIPIVFMTSLGNDADRLKGFEVGGEDYIIKPINHMELMARMKRFTTTALYPMADREALDNLIHSCLNLAEELAADAWGDAARDTLARLTRELSELTRVTSAQVPKTESSAEVSTGAS